MAVSRTVLCGRAEPSFRFKGVLAEVDESSVEVELVFELMTTPFSNAEAMAHLVEGLEASKMRWLRPEGDWRGNWIIDGNELMNLAAPYLWPGWAYKQMRARPSVSGVKDAMASGSENGPARIVFRLIEGEALSMERSYAPELIPSLKRFAEDHGVADRCGFLIMSFANSRLHDEILEALQELASKLKIEFLRADDGRYSDDLLANVRTYMHACAFGIAIFERILNDDFNPNVSFEVGYMMALGKPVCLLKDRTLPNLQSDLAGRLYETFDPQNAAQTIGPAVERWLQDKKIL